MFSPSGESAKGEKARELSFEMSSDRLVEKLLEAGEGGGVSSTNEGRPIAPPINRFKIISESSKKGEVTEPIGFGLEKLSLPMVKLRLREELEKVALKIGRESSAEAEGAKRGIGSRGIDRKKRPGIAVMRMEEIKPRIELTERREGGER